MSAFFARPIVVVLTMAGSGLSLAACGGGAEPPAPAQQQPSAAASAPVAAATQKPAPVDACALLSQADAETLTGRKMLAPVKSNLPSLSTCTYGDPESPKLPDGNALSQLLTLSVFAAEPGAYVGGPIAQARETYDIGLKNAAKPETTSGLGDAAYWDAILHTLHVLKGRYELSVKVPSALGVTVARKVADQVLPRLQ